MPEAQFTLCDVFATGPLSGNQLAVFVDLVGIATPEMAALSREFNFSEIAFAGPAVAGEAVPVRIFTPAAELPFAGHPILGTAAVLARAGGHRTGVAIECGVGVISCDLDWSDDRTAMVWMRQPVPTVQDFSHAGALCEALGVSGSSLPVEIYDNGMAHVYVGLGSEQEVADLRPDTRALTSLTTEHDVHAGISCFAGSNVRWKTRMFAPRFGVTEDPATGSAAGPLACHLVRHGLVDLGEMVEIHQGSELGRPSLLYAQVFGTDGQISDVRVGGKVQVVGAGTMAWP